MESGRAIVSGIDDFGYNACGTQPNGDNYTMRQPIFKMLILLGLVATVLVACNNDDGNGNNDDLPEPRPLLNETADHFDEATAFEMQLRQNGEPTLVTEALGVPITFDRAQAIFVAPDRLSALVNVAIDALTQEVEIVVVGGDQYAKNRFLTAGQWQEFVFASGFNGRDLQSDELGIGNALRDVQNLELQGREEIDSVQVYHLTGDVDARKVRSVTVGLIGTRTGIIPIEIFVRTRDSFLARIILTEPPKDESETETVWTVDFFGYNRDGLSVNAPDDPLPAPSVTPTPPEDETETDASDSNQG
jgi:hypothetical protein